MREYGDTIVSETDFIRFRFKFQYLLSYFHTKAP